MNTRAITKEEFLNKKRDYSPFLVHLTREGLDCCGNEVASAGEVLGEYILADTELVACNHFCLFKDDIDSLGEENKNKFKVVCFTETPIDQIEVLLEVVQGRNTILRPYGLVFTKDYIRHKEGNPVFYVDENMFDPLWKLYKDAKSKDFSSSDIKFLALVNKCDKNIDFHWEREWRIVGNLKFELTDIFCGLCPESKIKYFESEFPSVKFISPYWGINNILNKLVGK